MIQLIILNIYMCECAKCKRSYPEYELTWVTLPDTYYIQVRKSMELLCDECLKESKKEE